jgi:pyruvate,water dikinase
LAGLLDKIKNLFGKQDSPPVDETLLVEEFKDRYLSLRKLLAANNKALEMMAEMEEAISGERVFGMSFVRSRATAVLVSVYTMVDQLERLAPGKYSALPQNLDHIKNRLDRLLAPQEKPGGEKMVLSLSVIDKSMADEAGAKMANLGEIKNRLGLRVPPGFVITSDAWRFLLFSNGLDQEIARLQQAADIENASELFTLSSKIRQLVVQAALPPELETALQDAYASLASEAGGGVRFSLRSSAIGEDSAEASFAGQYSTQLNVAPEYLTQTYKEVAASFYTPQAMHYRLARGLRDDQLAMSVGCLAMVPAKSGGVAYTANPLDANEREVHITAAWGLPRVVVDGEAAGDHFVISRGEPHQVLHHQVEDKTSELVCHADDGVCKLELTGERASQACLSDEQAIELARAALKLEEHYGGPQDVEWAFDAEGRLFLLQCRPLSPIVQDRPAAAASGTAKGDLPEPLATGGVTASPGTGVGIVHWVAKDSDALTFPDGAILVLPHPAPRWAVLVNKASAVVSAKGGIAGHLATVCREYGVPALFSLGQATDRMVQGQEVTVSANARAIYPGLLELEDGKHSKQVKLMAGSPVQRLLRQALDEIAPLTLLNPDSPQFKAENVKTLHDITRFCHEKSVAEMFAFGKEHHFPRRAAKQLHYKVPMQWWVLDLDDGLTHEVSGKYVKLEDIASLPMLATWEGMTAVPWDGPPPVSGKGLASVMFQATANPALATGVKSRYADRNYFMVAKHFMNLQSRFGFHFCTVEALTSPRPRENYLSFSFKGGAADTSRRLGRVRFVSELLEERGFSVELVEDNLRARLERVEQDVLLAEVKVVGYLLMHTRQLDMIMADPNRVAYYRDKIKADMQTVLQKESAGSNSE